jgi:RNA polymerase sigma-70 factor (ECF subfamily)
VKGNATALEQLYRDRYRNYRDIMASVVGSHDLAREVVQEAFARALREQRKFRGEGSLEAWVWKIALNVALKKRHELLREWSIGDDEYEAGTFEPSPNHDVRAAVRALPPRRRLVVFLRYFADLSYPEIAGIAGVSEGTVAATLAQAKEELHGLLDGKEVGR